MLATSYQRGTKDSDVLQTSALDDAAATQLLTLAGPDTILAQKHHLYIEILPEAFPFLPRHPLWNRLAINLVHLEIVVLDVVDVVVSKLRRFHGNDIDDINAMIDLGLVAHDVLLQRFRSAFDAAVDTAHADELPRCVRNLNRIERDALDVRPSEFEYPSWVDDGD